MTVLNDPKWDRIYDVIVIGFGGAGATAARFAADNGAKVLLTDVAPLHHEGGNTRYAGQGVSSNHNPEKALAYYQSLYDGYDMDKGVLEALTNAQYQFPDYFEKFLDSTPISSLEIMKNDPSMPRLVPEYPGKPGYEAMDALLIHNGSFDSALWKKLRQKVLERADKIDVWLNSPATHLIQRPNDQTIYGAEINRKGKHVLIKAKKGVVLALGGFENNKHMVETFLGAPKLKPLGSLYNKGDGVKMVSEIGAKLWHMSDYEALGFSGFSVDLPDKSSGHLIMKWPSVSRGSIIITADDGGRFLREDEENKHGHLKDHDTYTIPTPQLHPHLVFDQTKFDNFKNEDIPEPEFFNVMIKADSMEELAKKIDADPRTLKQTILDFNKFAENGRDIQFNRNPETMRSFDNGPYYAVPMANTILNTQGGAEKNSRAQIINWDNQVIPHLYEAGEFGGLTGRLYNGATNLAECLIFGKIAGENVVKERALVSDNDVNTGASVVNDNLGNNDILNNNTYQNIRVGSNQLLGESNIGMGGTLYALVTFTNNKIAKVEFPYNHETEGIGSRAIEKMPDRIVNANSYNVDVVSGATVTSNAIKDAVKNALDKRNK